MENKICKKCGKLKPLSEYYPQKETRDRLFAHCKTCACLLAKEYRIQNKDALTEARRKYQAEHKDAARRWHAENKDARNESARRLYYENIEARKERAGRYRAENKDRILKKREERKLDSELHKKDIAARLEYNRNHLKERSAYEKRKYKTDINYSIEQIVRSSIRQSLDRKKHKKDTTTSYLVGCKIEKIVCHLEKQGYDKNIHEIDHIVPISRFDLAQMLHRRVAFNYKNIQPLEKSVNRSKRDKVLKSWQLNIINI